MRKQQENIDYDLLILGGGISGSTLFRVASDSKKRTILLEKKDFSSGTSQASGMMIWGGLLYLKNFEFGLVRKFCKARDKLIKYSNQVSVRRFHFALHKKGGRSFFLMKLGLALYRFIGLYKRSSTKLFSNGQLPNQWETSKFKGGLSYEEGFITNSDAQYTLQWLIRENNNSGSKAYNYSEISSIQWRPEFKQFVVQFTDHYNEKYTIRTKNIVNACGVWADKVNEQFGIRTKATHHFSKGVYLLFKNKLENKDAFVVDMQENNDVICWVPWGDTIMWGPTETSIDSIDEMPVTNEDVSFLIDKLNKTSSEKFTTDDIINVRTGIRPLVKEDNKAVTYSLDLSRKAILESDPTIPWYTIFGGKLSGSIEFSLKIFKNIFNSKPNLLQFDSNIIIPMTKDYFDDMELPDVLWSVKNTQVKCLDDYLRRRSNVAQWIPIGGIGFDNKYISDIERISRLIHSSEIEAEKDFKQYINNQIKERNNWKN